MDKPQSMGMSISEAMCSDACPSNYWFPYYSPGPDVEQQIVIYCDDHRCKRSAKYVVDRRKSMVERYGQKRHVSLALAQAPKDSRLPWEAVEIRMLMSQMIDYWPDMLAYFDARALAFVERCLRVPACTKKIDGYEAVDLSELRSKKWLDLAKKYGLDPDAYDGYLNK